MPPNRPEYDREYWLKNGHKRTLKVRLAEAEQEIERLRVELANCQQIRDMAINRLKEA